jgi:hypothetical protein
MLKLPRYNGPHTPEYYREERLRLDQALNYFRSMFTPASIQHVRFVAVSRRAVRLRTQETRHQILKVAVNILNGQSQTTPPTNRPWNDLRNGA